MSQSVWKTFDMFKMVGNASVFQIFWNTLCVSDSLKHIFVSDNLEHKGNVVGFEPFWRVSVTLEINATNIF